MTAPVVGSWGAPEWTASVANWRSCVWPFWPLEGESESPAIVVTGLGGGKENNKRNMQNCRTAEEMSLLRLGALPSKKRLKQRNAALSDWQQ